MCRILVSVIFDMFFDQLPQMSIFDHFSNHFDIVRQHVIGGHKFHFLPNFSVNTFQNRGRSQRAAQVNRLTRT